MAALDAPRDTPRRGIVRWFPNMPLGVTKIWAGGMVGVASTGLIGPLSDTTYTKFVGRAPVTVDNTGDEDLTMDVERGEFFVDNDGTNALTVAHVGPLLAGLVEWSDDHTAANATDTGSAVGGTVTEVTSEGVWIESP
jgi:hypothetical protein